MIAMFSDGASRRNPGPSGWGVCYNHEGQWFDLFGGVENSTNGRMEVLAALEAMKAALALPSTQFLLKSDAQYVVRGVNEWLASWKRRDWKKADGKQIEHKDLWVEIDLTLNKLRAAGKRFQVEWVRGHNGHVGNERADMLATSAANMADTKPAKR